MEAMESGLPVIAANAGALAELVHDGENGFCLILAIKICWQNASKQFFQTIFYTST